MSVNFWGLVGGTEDTREGMSLSCKYAVETFPRGYFQVFRLKLRIGKDAAASPAVEGIAPERLDRESCAVE